MIHAFNVEHAAKYGLVEAVLIMNFQNWIKHNQANDKHQNDGRTWTYNSNKALSKLFPYLTEKQVRRGLESLVEQGVLIKGNYNQSAYDRTCWYAFVDESIFLESHNHLPNKANGKAQEGEPIPSTIQLQYPSTEKHSEIIESPTMPCKKPLTVHDLIELKIDHQLAADFMANRKAKRAPLTQTALDGIAKEASKAGYTLEMALREIVMRGWQGFKAEWVTARSPPGQGFIDERERSRRAAADTIGVGSHYEGNADGQQFIS